jgi:hypothetical protein
MFNQAENCGLRAKYRFVFILNFDADNKCLKIKKMEETFYKILKLKKVFVSVVIARELDSHSPVTTIEFRRVSHFDAHTHKSLQWREVCNGEAGYTRCGDLDMHIFKINGNI